MYWLLCEMIPDVEQNQGADDRQNDACWVEGGAIGWFAEDARNQPANKRTCDAEHAGHENAEVFGPRHNQSSNGAYDDTDNKHPQVVQHGSVLS